MIGSYERRLFHQSGLAYPFMDINQIINLVITAVITIVITAAVTRLSLNKGRLGVTSKLKKRFTPKFRAYMRMILCLLMLIFSSFALFLLTILSSLPTRVDVLLIALYFALSFGSLLLTSYSLGTLLRVYRVERKRKEEALQRKAITRELEKSKPVPKNLRAAQDRTTDVLKKAKDPSARPKN